MSDDLVIIERDAAVAIVTINRPRVLNALNRATLEALSAAMRGLRDDAGVRAVILTGAGDKSFVAGADINELATLTPVAATDYALKGQAVLDEIEQMGKPVIAAVNGYALGGGCELASACTLRLAADTAKFGQPEIKLGLIPGFAGTQRLARLVGRGRALELILTGATIDAHEAYRIGLANRVVAASALGTEARALAQALAESAPIALRCAMDAIGHGLDMTQAEGCQLEASLFGLVASTADMREGTSAFLQKRKPVFTGQ
jgi:enoyl-CoA hydratase/carnithine racemase